MAQIEDMTILQSVSKAIVTVDLSTEEARILRTTDGWKAEFVITLLAAQKANLDGPD